MVRLREGDELVLTPRRIGRRGEAEAEHAGWRVRIRNGIVGEAARVRITHVSRGGPVAVAAYERPAESRHPARRLPPCPIHDPCGGCGLQHIAEPAALELKVAQARRLLPPAATWLEPLASPRALGYRSKTFLLPQRCGGTLRLGARPPRGPDLVDTTGCAVLRPALEALAARTRAALERRVDLDGRLRSAMLRCNRAGMTQLTLVHGGEPGPLGNLARACGADAAFLQRHDTPGNRICSDAEETQVAGDGPIEETYGGLAVAVPPTAFFQGNPDVAEELYREAARELDGPRIGELYCGAGAAGLLALAGHPGATLRGVDRSPRAVAAARANAARNGLADRCRFDARAAEDGGPAAWDVVLVNPPRAGCHARVVEAIAASGARKLVYLSCNPVTLARDAARLGWPVVSVRPADMLPQTPHLELLVVLRRP